MSERLPCETCAAPDIAKRILRRALIMGVDVEEVVCTQTPEEVLHGELGFCHAEFPGCEPEPGDRTYTFGDEMPDQYTRHY